MNRMLNGILKINSWRRGFARFTSNQLIALAVICFGLPYAVSAQTLEHRYSFDVVDNSTNVIDSVGGTNWSGTLVAASEF